MGVGNHKGEEAERECDHQNVHHEEPPLRLIANIFLLARRWAETFAANQRRNDHHATAFSLSFRCHSARRFPDGRAGKVIGIS
jgi:hypothetical protein